MSVSTSSAKPGKKSGSRAKPSFWGRLSTPNARFYVLIAFIILVFLTGGSSRDDMDQLIVLRPITALFAAYGLAYLDWTKIRAIGWPLWLLLALIGVVILQLIPLPPSIWTSLPLRDFVVGVEQAAGIEAGWRPLTLSPSKTANMLVALLIPLTALLLFGTLEPDRRLKVWPVIIGLAILSSVLGLVQLSGGNDSSAYFYRITNLGQTVGLFANRNHHSVFLAISILIAFWYFSTIKSNTSNRVLTSTFAAGSVFVFSLSVIFAYSRAGLGIAGLSLLLGLAFLMRAELLPKFVQIGRKRRITRKTLILILGGAGALLAATTLAFSRAAITQRFAADEGVDELRVKMLPIFEEMLGDSFPFGTGFGTFEYVFPLYEPLNFLRPAYVNLAHNDWAQWAIEGGLPGLFIAVIFGLFIARAAWKAWRGKVQHQLMALGLIGLLLLASAVDYPLRTPALMVVFTLACATIASKPVSRASD